MVSSGGGDPLCTSSGVVSCCATGVLAASSFRGGLRLPALARLAGGRRFAAGRRLALVRRFPVVRRFEVAPRLPEVRRFEGVRRFTCVRFFRAEREVAARFLRFAIYVASRVAHHSIISSQAANPVFIVEQNGEPQPVCGALR
jgi:hypothetical protein